jgi:hypothetical protein
MGTLNLLNALLILAFSIRLFILQIHKPLLLNLQLVLVRLNKLLCLSLMTLFDLVPLASIELLEFDFRLHKGLVA